MKKHILIFLFTYSVCLLWGQSVEVHIVDENNEGIPGVLLSTNSLKEGSSESTKKTKTDVFGKATIRSVDSLAIHVQMAFYKDTVLVAKNESIKVALIPNVHVYDQAVVTAQYCNTTAEKSVYKVQVINNEEIEQRAANNLKDLLATQMNMRLEQDNVLGTGVSMQGMSGENVKILIDGVPVIGRQDGNIDLSQINLQNIERVEIVEGPLSVSYGTNALAGTINLISKKDVSEKGKLNLDTYYESVGQYNISTRYAKKVKKHGFAVNFGRNYFDGYSAADTSRNQEWKPKEQYNAGLMYKVSFSDFYIRWNGDYFYEKMTNKGALRRPLYETAFDEYYHTNRYNTSLFFKWYLSNNWTFTNTANYSFYERKKNQYFVDLTTLDEVLTGQENQDTSRFDLIMNRGAFTFAKDSSKLSYQLGYDINIEATQGERIEGQKNSIGDYAVFASAEYQIGDKLVIRPGLRYAYNTAYEAPLVPSLNVRYQASKSSVVRVSYAKGFRTPSLKELYFNFVDLNHDIHGNENLSAETTNSFQGQYSFKKEVNTKTFTSDVVMFYNHLENKIDLLSLKDDGYYQYINIGKFITSGIQLNVGLSYKTWSFGIGGNYTARYNEISDTADVQSFFFSPEGQVNVQKTFPKQGVTIALYFKYTGELPQYFVNDDDEIEQGYLAAYQMMDLTLTKKLWKDRLLLSTGVKNLFDVTNVSSSGSSGTHSTNSGSTSVGWGRTFFVGLKFNFGA